MKQMAWRGALAALILSAVVCRREASSPALPPSAARISQARFHPPADGQLTEAQIDEYVRVRRGSRGRSDADGARAAGIDLEEYSWVRARVIEALVALDTRQVRTAAEETYTKTAAALKQARRDASDPVTQRTLDDQIAGLERERATLKKMEALPLSVAVNAKRLARRRGEIEGLSP